MKNKTKIMILYFCTMIIFSLILGPDIVYPAIIGFLLGLILASLSN